MSDKPWAEPGLTIEERAKRLAGHLLVSSNLEIYEPHCAEAFRAIRADALEEVAALLEEMAAPPLSSSTCAVMREFAFSVRSLKTRAPTS